MIINMKAYGDANNSKWGVDQFINANREFYNYAEFNTFETTNAPSIEFQTVTEISKYANGDLGKTLNEVKHANTMSNTVGKALTVITIATGVAAVGVATVLTNIQDSIPKIQSFEISMNQCVLSYSFHPEVAYEATLFVDLQVGGVVIVDESYELPQDESISGSVTYPEGTTYVLTISYQGRYGGGTLKEVGGSFK